MWSRIPCAAGPRGSDPDASKRPVSAAGATSISYTGYEPAFGADRRLARGCVASGGGGESLLALGDRAGQEIQRIRFHQVRVVPAQVFGDALALDRDRRELLHHALVPVPAEPELVEHGVVSVHFGTGCGRTVRACHGITSKARGRQL